MQIFRSSNFAYLTVNRMKRMGPGAVVSMLAVLFIAAGLPGIAAARPRIIIETDIGGDPDDEQSLVRFLLYANDLDVEGIICNREKARDGENLNPERTGIGIARAMVRAYGQCYPNLMKHDRRYPAEAYLQKRTIAGYTSSEEAVNLIIAAVDRRDSRPLWFCDWGTADLGADESNLKRALDRVLKERGQEGYARFKSRIRLSSADAFGDHTRKLQPPFPLWVDTFHPELEKKRWYHRFSALTATAGGFDVERDVRTGHGPLGAMYPTNTTHRQKEGDTMAFLYLVPTGMNDPDHPEWGSWGGRYGLNPGEAGRQYYWANQADEWQGSIHRDNTLKRWATDLQNDFKARLNWCITDYAHANHAPVPRLTGSLQRTVKSGAEVTLDARRSTDPDGNALQFRWELYPEPGTYRGTAPILQDASSARAHFTAPSVISPQTMHFICSVTDKGSPPLTRYLRVIVTVTP
jgi:hypothetical protein